MINSYFVIGVSHRTASGTLRDRLFTEPAETPAVLDRLRAGGVAQAVWLSTCDRVEVIGAAPDPVGIAARIAQVMSATGAVEPKDVAAQLRTLTGEHAIRHVFAVASSLDSQVVGEPQVLGQVKTAYRQSVAAGLVGSDLEALLQAAFATAKRVRSETGIAERPGSIAAAAVDIARDLHGDLGRRKGLLIGLGDMGLLMVEQLREAGLGALTVCTPVDARAESASRRLDCHFAPFAELEGALAGADIVISAVGLGRHILTAAPVASALRRRRRQPIFIIDAALPTDVDPAVGEIDAAFVYDLADLERVTLQGRVGREAAAAAAWALVDQAVAAFARDRSERAATPLVSALRHHFEAERRRVLAETAGRDADEVTRRLVNRLLHGPCEALRRLAADPDGETFSERTAAERLLRTLFRLDGPAEEDDAS